MVVVGGGEGVGEGGGGEVSRDELLHDVFDRRALFAPQHDLQLLNAKTEKKRT